MESDNSSLPAPQRNLKTGSQLDRMNQAVVGFAKINASSDEEIKEALKYIMIMLGTPSKDVPDDIEDVYKRQVYAVCPVRLTG